MPEEFPTNSNSKRRPDAEPRKIEKVIEGDVTRRKKGFGKRFMESFVSGEDAKGVIGGVVFDIMLPAAQDLVVSAGEEVLRRTFYGGGGSKKSGHRPGGGSSGTRSEYNRMYKEDPASHRPGISSRGRSQHDFDEIVIPNRHGADEVVEGLLTLVDDFNQATVADFYDLVGVSSDFTDNKYGWTNLRGIDVIRARGGGYIIDLPKPKPLD